MTTLPFVVITLSAWDDGQSQEEIKTFPTADAALAYMAEQITWAEVVSTRCPALRVELQGEYLYRHDN